MLIAHFASAAGGLRPQIPYWGFVPGPHWELRPQTLWPSPPPREPSTVKSWARLWLFKVLCPALPTLRGSVVRTSVSDWRTLLIYA